ncbi:response regulator [Rickettsiales endosymbiont of Stachyamoeba lipophora]|uniref:hypothetical protein n=1 Tax=Rickettsiales endosymbiont of Stachyamoeba lipophora TaxID=2486578 RepID=UPI000F64CED2|nr:hypothetical protein [Rickettsiales endosymbiont of Stachyamoeba lipophora]AZL16115.1 hypothetical protein EF513_06170 [Rickettsiales endosymbiont of Stachyamoeba lipophora]
MKGSISNLSLFNHPTTVVLIDDNQDYLDALVAVMPDEENVYKLFSNPHQASAYLASYKEETTNNPLKIDRNDEEDVIVGLEAQSIYCNLYNPKRFNNISAIIVDYEMYGHTGLDILSKVKDQNIYKILLTGVADEKIAIDAFNKGLIDQYVKKHSFTVVEELRSLIVNNNVRFFDKKSEHIRQTFGNLFVPSIFKHEKFIELVNSIRKEKEIVEYYLCDNTGSLILVDSDKKIGALCVYNEEQMKCMQDILAENNISSNTATNKDDYHIVCYIHGLTSWTENLLNNVYKAYKLDLDQTYYYSFIEDIQATNLNKVVSFSEFKNQAQ